MKDYPFSRASIGTGTFHGFFPGSWRLLCGMRRDSYAFADGCLRSTDCARCVKRARSRRDLWGFRDLYYQMVENAGRTVEGVGA